MQIINAEGGWNKFKAFRDTFDFFGKQNPLVKDQLGFSPMESFIYNPFSNNSPNVDLDRQVLHEPQGRPDHDVQRQRLGRPEGLEEHRRRVQVHEGRHVGRRMAHRGEEALRRAQGRRLDVHGPLHREHDGRQEDRTRTSTSRSASRSSTTPCRPSSPRRGTASSCRRPRAASSSSRPTLDAVNRVLAGQQTPKAGAEPGAEGSADRDQRQQVVANTRRVAAVTAPARTAPGPSRARRWFAGFRERETWVAYLFILPWLFGFLVFTLGPMLFSLYYSFTNYGLQQIAGLEPTKTVGLKNYQPAARRPEGRRVAEEHLHLHGDDGAREDHLRARCSRCCCMRVGEKLAGVFRTIFYLPHMTPPVAIGVMLLFLFNGRVGHRQPGAAPDRHPGPVLDDRPDAGSSRASRSWTSGRAAGRW